MGAQTEGESEPGEGRCLLNTGGSLRFPRWGVDLCWSWGPLTFLRSLGPGCGGGGSPRSPAARLAESRPPAGAGEAPQPLGGSVAAATSSPALRSRTPAWSGSGMAPARAPPGTPGWPRRPPGRRSIAASRLRPPACAHCPPSPRLRPPARAPPPAPLSAPLGARPRARALSPARRSPPAAPSPARRGADFPRAEGWRAAPHPAFRPRWVLAPVGCFSPSSPSFLGQSPQGARMRLGDSGESERVTWSTLQAPAGPDCLGCPSLLWGGACVFFKEGNI